MKSFRALLGLTVAVLALAQSQVQAASDIFVRFVTPGSGVPGYTGDSTNLTFPGSQGWFQVESVGLGMENVITIGGATGGAGAGKARALELSCVKSPNSASAALFTSCAMGGHWDVMEIVYTKPTAATGKSETYLKVELKLVLVSKLDLKANTGDDKPTEEVSIAYGAQRLTFYAAPTSGPGTPVKTGEAIWSFVLNKNVFATS
ncbi:type VI secretion system tube protein Hcp [Haloferula sp. BvORR071]|uniref:type VI secretion system tube protein Hcp n=1 Tax=Haloferula sp. BvORR071 TaxID=1396141 RepID=UPI000550A8CA|nr:type VI secretion system tube protein Hcp [Haloferula sp. BvORR071]